MIKGLCLLSAQRDPVERALQRQGLDAVFSQAWYRNDCGRCGGI
jgi:hypothetical protein